MPVTLETCEHGRVQTYTFTEPWTIEEILALYPSDSAYKDSVNFTVHTLADLTQARQVPNGVLKARHGSPLNHPRRGQLVLVGGNRLMTSMAEVFMRLARVEGTKFFNTREAAWTYLRQWIAEHPE